MKCPFCSIWVGRPGNEAIVPAGYDGWQPNASNKYILDPKLLVTIELSIGGQV